MQRSRSARAEPDVNRSEPGENRSEPSVNRSEPSVSRCKGNRGRQEQALAALLQAVVVLPWTLPDGNRPPARRNDLRAEV